MAASSSKLQRAVAHVRQQYQTRRDFSEIAKTLLVVIPLTLLIWVFAERAQVKPQTFSTIISVKIPPPTELTAVVVGQSAPVSISVSGPLSQVDRLRDNLRERTMDGLLELNLPNAQAAVGDQSFDLAQALDNDPLFKSSGVTIVSVTPPQLRILIEQVVQRQVGLQAPPPDAQAALQNVTFDPPQVLVRGPQQAVDELARDNRKLSVDLSGITNLAAAAGKPVEVSVIAPTNSRITVNPQRVRITFELGSRESEFEIPSVAITVDRPLALDGRIRVRPKGVSVLHNVKIRGPDDQIQKFRGDTPQLRVTAVIRVSADDVGKTISPPIEFAGLPPGVSVTSSHAIEVDVESIAAER